MYKLVYLPLTRRDMAEIVRYIACELHNPDAAQRLATELVDAAERVAAFPYANEGYIPIQRLKHEYRRVIVHNYVMFYWVDEKRHEVTIARVVYVKRDLKDLL